MRKFQMLAVTACTAVLLSGCQATAPKSEVSAEAVKPVATSAAVLTTATPSTLPANTVESTNAMGKLLRDGAQYVLYSSDPPVTLELPRTQVSLTGQHAKLVMKYVQNHHCIPLENAENSETANLVTVCLEDGSMVLRTLDSLAYKAASEVASEDGTGTVALPADDKLVLPTNIAGENDDGEGDENAPQRMSIIALPQAGDGLTGYRVAEYLVLPLPSKWLDDTPLAQFAASSGCRLLNPFAAPHDEYALCYVDDVLTLVPEKDLEQLAAHAIERVEATEDEADTSEIEAEEAEEAATEAETT